MRLQSILSGGLSLAAALLSVSAASAVFDSDPEIIVTATFPETNQFGHVVNGEGNKLIMNIENKSGRNVTLDKITGSFHHPENNALVKNTTSLSYNLPLMNSIKVQVPYTFHSEFKPGDLRLNIWLEHTADGQKYRVTAYDSIVTIVEPERSIFDLKMLATYLITLAFFGGIGYATYTSLFPSRAPRKKVESISEPVGTVLATGSGGYQEEWIPEHHLKKTTKRTKSSGGGLTSGDESGIDSGAEKRSKSKK